MADNLQITAGSGTTVAADDIGGVKYQRVKVTAGADGAATDLQPGTGTASAALRVVTASDDAIHGAVNETAPASDTASSGLNGRLQRIAQRLTSLIALFPSSIGQKATTGSLSVTLSSDHAVLSTDAASATYAATITPNNSVDIARNSRAVYIGSAGDLKVTMVNGDVVTFVGLSPGWHPIQVKRIWSTGTSASNIVAVS